MKYKLIIFLVFLFGSFTLFAQSDLGSAIYQKTGIHSGNRVKTVFQNAGTVGQPPTKGPRGAWKYENNGYIGDVSFMVGTEVKMNPNTDRTSTVVQGIIAKNNAEIFHSVTISDVDRPATPHENNENNTGRWTFNPKPGYFNSNQESIAMSDNPDSWPASWPDKLNDATDPGWKGSWNGYFGKEPKANQESFFVMDDQTDYEFNLAPFNHVPDATRIDRKGMGIDVKVRGMQWSNFLAQDCIFWLYDVRNSSTTDYDKAVVGLLCGTLVGVTGGNAYQEYDDDVSFFDVQNSLVYTWDFDNNVRGRNPRWVGDEVGYVGYAFLESPGNGYDGIDNDRDAKSAPLFESTGFDSVLVVSTSPSTGKVNKLVVIKDDFTRQVLTVQSNTPFKIKSRGMADSILITPNITKLAEGNVLKADANGNITPNGITEVPNPNASDGIDNDFDGLIDENYFLHYRQRKTTIVNGNQIVLFDVLAPTRFYDYINEKGLNDLLVDEKRDDGIDNDNDWISLTDDVGADGVENSGDVGENDGISTNGEPNFDATDVNESDQIGLTSFNYFTPAGIINLKDDEKLWTDLRPGFFSVPNNFSNGVPINGEDGDFTFGSGYFPLLSHKTEFFSFALVYGKDKQDMYNHRKTVQKIYDSNYLFPLAPKNPTVKVVVDDHKVTLYWNRVSEETIDPVLKIKDFEGYKIYKSRDNNFNDINNVTNAYGEAVGYTPLAVFDIPNNNIYGLFKPNSDLFEESRGYSYYLGDDKTGLAHSYVDNDVQNGVRYFYAVVPFDAGDQNLGIFPSENTKTIKSLQDGSYVTDINTAVVIPEGRSSDFSSANSFSMIHTGNANGRAFNSVIDATKLKDNIDYEIRFIDTHSDGVDNDGNGLKDQDDIGELVPITTGYSVVNTTGVTETFNGSGSGSIQLTKFDAFVDSLNIIIKDNTGAVVPSASYKVDGRNGRIKPRNGFLFDENKIYSAFYNPYGIYRSIYMKGNPNAVNDATNDVAYDGISYNFNNYWDVLAIPDSSVFNKQTDFRFSASRQNTASGTVNSPNRRVYTGLNLPYDYEIEFYSGPGFADTSYAGTIGLINAVGRPVKFKVKNLTLNKYSDFYYQTTKYAKYQGNFGRGDFIIVLEQVDKNYNKDSMVYNTNNSVNGKYLAFTYNLLLIKDGALGDTSITDTSLRWKLITQKPFSSQDIFSFKSVKGQVSQSNYTSKILSEIQVVPNPYLAYNSIENPLPPLITSGRSERRIEFRKLPNGSKIHLFTSSGEHVRTLYDDGSYFTGTIKWDLKTKENLDIAAGIYFYVVESPYGKKEGKIAIIK